jgi:hypothetical protein
MVSVYKDPKGDKIFSGHSTNVVGCAISVGGGEKDSRVVAVMERVKDLEKKLAEQQSVVRRGAKEERGGIEEGKGGERREVREEEGGEEGREGGRRGGRKGGKRGGKGRREEGGGRRRGIGVRGRREERREMRERGTTEREGCGCNARPPLQNSQFLQQVPEATTPFRKTSVDMPLVLENENELKEDAEVVDNKNSYTFIT